MTEISATPMSSSAATPEAPAAATVRPALMGGPDFTRIAGRAVKGVANISSLQVEQRRSAPTDDPFFNYFFGNQDLFGARSRRSLSLGSGAIVSPDGYIVTNNHVVGEGADTLTVTLDDGRELTAKVVGRDPATDIAVIKVDAQGLPARPRWVIPTSSRSANGCWRSAARSGIRQTVTSGIVSATGRRVGILSREGFEDFIQTDAAINPGNSGGALVDSRRAAGRHQHRIFSQSGGYQGIGFAVPSNLAKHVADDLMKFGQVRRGTIGGIVQIEALSPQIAPGLGDPNTSGARSRGWPATRKPIRSTSQKPRRCAITRLQRTGTSEGSSQLFWSPTL